ncbi:MAG: lysophospholipid acyltransferase family protein [Candidatus Omnitrophica bacterium]|nr:lysophospholipid acyltransferase family protein [Candidatus Omnitrophota bacterium]MDD5311285.1 lysophospholipid acyltransferase family protein [Candidatus Omnitrophota bacterium]MDD5546851.1 lysophospholipid acyltransferase family protein [Candidatus Omnitrophota bacterium]
MMYFLVRNTCKLFLSMYMGFRVYGQENIPKKGAFILASNHVSHLDPPAMSAASPRRLRFMARRTLSDNWLFRQVVGRCNLILVNRDKGDIGAMKTAIRLLRSGKAVFLFPEGTRSETGQMNEAQPGIGYLSLMTGSPIVPAYVEGTDKALPKGAKRIIRTPIAVHIGDLIDPKKLDLPRDKKEAAQKLADHVAGEIKRLGDSVKK